MEFYISDIYWYPDFSNYIILQIEQFLNRATTTSIKYEQEFYNRLQIYRKMEVNLPLAPETFLLQRWDTKFNVLETDIISNLQHYKQ